MDYPYREPFFAHRFVRILHKSCAAQDLGVDTCWLLCVVAHTEDAARYSGPVRFWNSQLMETMGYKSPKQLNDARRRAVDGGWLFYDRAGNRTVGQYFVRIPARFSGLSDTPIEPPNRSAGGTNNGTNSGIIPPAERITERIAERLGNGSRNESETESGKLSCPIPLPSPNPRIEEPPRAPPKNISTYDNLNPEDKAAVDRWQDYWEATQTTRWDVSQRDASLMDAARRGLSNMLPAVIDFSISRNCKSWKDPADDFDRQRKIKQGKPERRDIKDVMDEIR